MMKYITKQTKNISWLAAGPRALPRPRRPGRRASHGHLLRTDAWAGRYAGAGRGAVGDSLHWQHGPRARLAGPSEAAQRRPRRNVTRIAGWAPRLPGRACPTGKPARQGGSGRPVGRVSSRGSTGGDGDTVLLAATVPLAATATLERRPTPPTTPHAPAARVKIRILRILCTVAAAAAAAAVVRTGPVSGRPAGLARAGRRSAPADGTRP